MFEFDQFWLAAKGASRAFPICLQRATKWPQLRINQSATGITVDIEEVSLTDFYTQSYPVFIRWSIN